MLKRNSFKAVSDGLPQMYPCLPHSFCVESRALCLKGPNQEDAFIGFLRRITRDVEINGVLYHEGTIIAYSVDEWNRREQLNGVSGLSYRGISRLRKR